MVTRSRLEMNRCRADRNRRAGRPALSAPTDRPSSVIRPRRFASGK